MAKHLTVGDNRSEVFYLGYRLKVTPSEYKILTVLDRSDRCSTNELTELLGFDATKKGNVAVHICSINRKAVSIGERKLILCQGSEYFFNEYM